MGNLKVIIGRSPQCDFIIDNAEQHRTVSGTHATISETENQDVLLFEDHSTNGSFVNGKFVHNDRCEIRMSDHITLGKTYNLPLEDIVRRFLSPSRTTKRKPVNQTPTPNDIPTYPLPIIDQGTRQPQVDESPGVSSDTFSENRNGMPVWLWIIFIVVAFALGVVIGELLI